MTKVICLFFVGVLLAPAEFYKIRLSDLRTEGEHRDLLEGRMEITSWRGGARSLVPVARFENFAFVVPDPEDNPRYLEGARRGSDAGGLASAWLVMEVTDKIGRKGFLDVWDNSSVPNQWRRIPCEIRSAGLKECDDKERDLMLAWHDLHRITTSAPGGLWYRARTKNDGRERAPRDFDRTFEVLSGGRALAENLALDRDLVLGRDGKGGEVEVALSDIKGVTVAPIRWEEKMPKGEIEVDPLAMKVPADQHLLIVPSLGDFFDLVKQLEMNGTPILKSFSEGRDYRELLSRYRRQMGLDVPAAFARLLPVKAVGMTGGDPFFPTGSDVALILETDQPGVVMAALKKTVEAKAAAAGAERVPGNGFAFRNADRSFSCYLLELAGAVVISNSPAQLARLQAVAERKSPALGATDEYRFFRHRYPLGMGESAYVFISDACLRRWCGPEVRIGASRRNRAVAALAAITASHLLGESDGEQFGPLLGGVRVVDDRIISEHYGSLGFLTPVGELGLKKVTAMEKAAYERWREGYENGWARFFDPIAIQFRLGKDRQDLDLTVLPLRVDSDYEEIIRLAGSSVLSKGASHVPGESVFHFAMAVDKKSETFKKANVGLLEFLPDLNVNPLGWMGDSVSVTLGNDLVWETKIEEDHLTELPVLLRVDVESKLKLALVLTAVKGAIETASPDLVDWQTKKHGEIKYVEMKGDGDDLGIRLSIYYATLPGAFLVSPNEDMLKRAIDREVNEPKKGKAEGQILAQTTPQFLSSAVAMGSGFDLAERQRYLSYQCLPILNEWYKARDVKDPVAFHLKRFAQRIECPGGKGFRWNQEDLTMESVVYGHPGRPLGLEIRPQWLERFETLRAIASFEDGGLRMKVGIDAQATLVDPVVKGTERPGDDEVVPFRDLLLLKPGTKSRYRSVHDVPFDDDSPADQFESEVLSVTEKEGVLLIEEKTVFGGEEEEFEETNVYELSPKGYRFVKSTVDGEVADGEDAYLLPAELWPGRKFQFRHRETWREEGEEFLARVEGVVSVIGWEMIDGPGGEKVKALKIERVEASLAGREDFSRTLTTEWYARGLGLVKSEENHSWGRTTTTLETFTLPE